MLDFLLPSISFVKKNRFAVSVALGIWITTLSFYKLWFQHSIFPQFRSRPSTYSPCGLVSFPGPGSESHWTKHNGTHWPWQNFKTSSLRPPEFEIKALEEARSPGFVFMAYKNAPMKDGAQQAGRYIMTDDGQLVWGREMQGDVLGNLESHLRVQMLDGKPVLTYWAEEDHAMVGVGFGGVHILDETYTEIHTVCLNLGLTVIAKVQNNSCQGDFHEATITEEGTMLVTAYNMTSTDLSSLGGSVDGWVHDSLAVEVDIKTGEVLFIWSALAHIPVSATHVDYAAFLGKGGVVGTEAWPIDYFHINSIEKVDGKYLINSRYTWGTYLVGPNGDIEWSITGDTGGDFGPLPDGANFAWQHDARVLSYNSTNAVISWFDNAFCEMVPRTVPSHGLILSLPLPPGSGPATIVRTLSNPNNPQFAHAEGQVTRLQNGNFFIGYGPAGEFQEFSVSGDESENGKLLLDVSISFYETAGSYRLFKSEWRGLPHSQPEVVLEMGKTDEGCLVGVGYVSWEGATHIVAWNVYASEFTPPSDGSISGSNAGRYKTHEIESTMVLLGEVLKKGFETRFLVNPATACVQVGAVDEMNEVRKSKIVCRPGSGINGGALHNIG